MNQKGKKLKNIMNVKYVMHWFYVFINKLIFLIIIWISQLFKSKSEVDKEANYTRCIKL